jgi:phage tail-like protein
MALSADAQKKSYPLVAYNFRVSVAEISMSFTEISGLAVEHDYATYRHGLSFLEGESLATVYFDRFIPVTCKRGVILGSNPFFLYDWLKKGDLRSMNVSLCDETGTPVLSWKVAAAVPTSLKAASFSASANEAAIDSVELRVRGVLVATP